ncbi:MAG: hypothetical protein KKD56_11530 [Acidobacteria bacterium]|nr:hypothetical protein [Acidobacteriota bacterium]MBU4254872.1 hypothetical protein [Acidobacteriota bacterium]
MTALSSIVRVYVTHTIEGTGMFISKDHPDTHPIVRDMAASIHRGEMERKESLPLGFMIE